MGFGRKPSGGCKKDNAIYYAMNMFLHIKFYSSLKYITFPLRNELTPHVLLTQMTKL